MLFHGRYEHRIRQTKKRLVKAAADGRWELHHICHCGQQFRVLYYSTRHCFSRPEHGAFHLPFPLSLVNDHATFVRFSEIILKTMYLHSLRRHKPVASCLVCAPHTGYLKGDIITVKECQYPVDRSDKGEPFSSPPHRLWPGNIPNQLGQNLR